MGRCRLVIAARSFQFGDEDEDDDADVLSGDGRRIFRNGISTGVLGRRGKLGILIFASVKFTTQ